jgi:tetratricopeptide (TPR) repeat protein
VVLAIAGGLYFRSHKAQALTEKDAIVLADFVNTTGDPVFDGTLRQALAVQLGQSPYLNIFPQERVRETLRYMGRSPDERVTPDLARQVCQREGIKAVLNGSITSIGSQYVVGVDAMNCQTGDTLASEQIEVSRKEEVLGAVGKAASNLRGKLGESLASIQKFDAPVQEATTGSLEALKAFSMGEAERDKGAELAAIPLYKHAIELDPNFAVAYARLGQIYDNEGEYAAGIESMRKAFELRDRASELEKLYISSHYYAIVTGEIDKEIEVYNLWKQTYPRDAVPTNNLTIAYSETGRFEESLQEALETLRLAPHTSFTYFVAPTAYLHLNRFAEAKALIQRAETLKLDFMNVHRLAYDMAFLEADTTAMQHEVEWSRGKPEEYFMLDTVAQSEAASGKLQSARKSYEQSVEMAKRGGFPGGAADCASHLAIMEALAGNASAAQSGARAALALDRSQAILAASGLAAALAGDLRSATAAADELHQRFPTNTLSVNLDVSAIRGAVALNQHNPAQALQLLQAAAPYELGFDAVPNYIRGLAYLQAKQGTEAAAEFRKILDHRWVGLRYALRSWSHLQLGRALALAGDNAGARTAYQDFFALWKDADPDVPALKQAKAEYDKLK